MKKNDSKVKEALDEIFSDDFIEIDSSSKKDDNNSLISNAIFTDFELEDEKEEQLKNNSVSETSVRENIIENENIMQNNLSESIKSYESNRKNIKHSSTINYKYVIVTIIIMIIIFLLSMVVFIGIIGINRTTICELAASDTGYQFSDKYEILYNKDKIIKIKSEYVYKATSEEFKEQVKYVKESKLPVVINSNGIRGFTYTIEENDNMFKVSGYLNFEEMDFKEIDKQDYDLFPLTYVKINSKTTYSNFTNKLKKQGFACKYK